MTFRDFQPDILTTTTPTTTMNINNNNKNASGDGVAKRCKSMNDICYSTSGRRTNNNTLYHNTNACTNCNNSNNTFLNKSFDSDVLQMSKRTNRCPRVIYRQESCPGETDIELEPHQINKRTVWAQHRQCHRCCSDPLPFLYTPRSKLHNSLITSNNIANAPIPNDTTDNVTAEDSIPKQNNSVQTSPSRAPMTTRRTQEISNVDPPQLETGLEMKRERLQRRATELIIRHFPDVQHSGELESAGDDEQLCHSIVLELKHIADNFDAKHAEKNGMTELQDLTKLLLPVWIKQGIVPAVVKTTLDLALKFYKL